MYQPQPHSQASLLCLILLDQARPDQGQAPHFFSELWKAILPFSPILPHNHTPPNLVHMFSGTLTRMCAYIPLRL